MSGTIGVLAMWDTQLTQGKPEYKVRAQQLSFSD